MSEIFESELNGTKIDPATSPTAEPTLPSDIETSSDSSDDSSKKDSKLTQTDVVKSIVKSYSTTSTDTDKASCNSIIKQYLKEAVKEYKCCANYNILVLYDNGTMVKSDADRIYNAVSQFTEKKPLLLILYSGGGSPGSAFLIGKLCIDNSKDKFVIAVPRMAKSAATLLCCAATEIHMGSLSELGPIDPQIDGMPTLGLKYSVEHIAELAKKYPSASEMFSKYLHSSLPLIHLGYYERVAESATHYAERLLESHKDKLANPPKGIAKELVYKYKDHSFVIDKSEAAEIFGDETIKVDTDEYALGNRLYIELSFMYRIANLLDHNFYFTGSLDMDPVFQKHDRT
jgi:hypothetical protein